jgi:perosamine synthetase
VSQISIFNCQLERAALDLLEPVFAAGQLAAGPHVPALEEAISAYLQSGSVVAMGDMTHALTLALQLAEVGPGDEVLTLSFNCLSSNSAICAAGATPVWVDIDPQRATMSVEDAKQVITKKTKAVIVYHVAGYPADLAQLRQFCDAHRLVLIEDANNAIGAIDAGQAIGSVGDFAVVSFYANRQINAIEGAALVCRDPAKADAARRLRRFGIDTKRFRGSNGEIDPSVDVPVIGMSSALTNVNAALARHGLQSLSTRLAKTRDNAALLTTLLDGAPDVASVTWASGSLPSFWTYLVLCEERDQVLTGLKSNGIDCTKLHQPNHLYSGFNATARELPGTASFARRALAIPCGWWLSEADIHRVAIALRTSAHQRCDTKN